MKVRKSRSKLKGTCRLMLELNRHIDSINRAHNIELTDKEVEKLKSMICGNVCNGSCRVPYVSILQ